MTILEHITSVSGRGAWLQCPLRNAHKCMNLTITSQQQADFWHISVSFPICMLWQIQFLNCHSGTLVCGLIKAQVGE